MCTFTRAQLASRVRACVCVCVCVSETHSWRPCVSLAGITCAWVMFKHTHCVITPTRHVEDTSAINTLDNLCDTHTYTHTHMAMTCPASAFPYDVYCMDNAEIAGGIPCTRVHMHVYTHTCGML